jgi:hypothetical protein
MAFRLGTSWNQLSHIPEPTADSIPEDSMEAKIKMIPFFKAQHWSHGVGVSGVFTREWILLEIGTIAANRMIAR